MKGSNRETGSPLLSGDSLRKAIANKNEEVEDLYGRSRDKYPRPASQSTSKKALNPPDTEDLIDENGETHIQRSDRISGSSPQVIASDIPLDRLEEPAHIREFDRDHPVMPPEKIVQSSEARKAAFAEIRQALDAAHSKPPAPRPPRKRTR